MIHSFIMTHACSIRDHLILYYLNVFSYESVWFNLLLHRQSCQLQHMRWTLSANMFIELLSIDWWNKLLTSQHMFLICWIYLILNHMFCACNRAFSADHKQYVFTIVCFWILLEYFCLLIPQSQNILIGYIFSVFDLLPLVLKYPHIASHL